MISKTLARKYMAEQRELRKLVDTDKAELIAENIKLQEQIKALNAEAIKLKDRLNIHDNDIGKLKEDVSSLETADIKEIK